HPSRASSDRAGSSLAFSVGDDPALPFRSPLLALPTAGSRAMHASAPAGKSRLQPTAPESAVPAPENAQPAYAAAHDRSAWRDNQPHRVPQRGAADPGW